MIDSTKFLVEKPHLIELSKNTIRKNEITPIIILLLIFSVCFI